MAGALVVSLLSSCGSGSGSVDAVVSPAEVGNPAPKPDNEGDYIVDQHFGGQADAVFVEQLYWGRLVDIWSEDPSTGIGELVYRDMVIGDNVLTQFGKWRLEPSPLTGRTRLVIERVNTEAPGEDFDIFVAEAEGSVGPVLEKGLGAGVSPPFSFVARNAALVLRFSDLVDPDTVSLNNSFRVLVGNPPEGDFEARLFFSPNHGGLATGSGEFFSTRMIVDFTIDSNELAVLDDPLELNGLGLPPTIDPLQANVAIRIPTQIDPAGASFELMRNLRGKPFAFTDNGPVDGQSPTLDVVRSMRSGYDLDPENGFLADNLEPSIIGSLGVSISSAVEDPSGNPGEDFVVNFSYDVGECSISPTTGDVVRIGGFDYEVTQDATVSQGIVSGVRISLPEGVPPVASTATLLGQALFRTNWRNDLPISLAPCFVRFTPEPSSAPAAGIDPGAQVIVEFSEPMDPVSVRPFDTFVASRTEEIGGVGDYVVSNVTPSADLRTYRLSPVVGFSHSAGVSEQYNITLSSNSEDFVGLTDLSGNFLTAALPQVKFLIDSTAAEELSGGWALAFNSQDEFTPGVLATQDGDDLAGQVFYDLDRGEIFPRNVTRFAAVADRSNLLIGAMQPIATGLQTPLSNLGSKLHIQWRYADVGYPLSRSDGTFVNLDVEGISLSPIGGSVTQTFYPQFEMTLGHCARTPDETVDGFLLPEYALSGFLPNKSYAENFLADSSNPPKVVHEREEGFFVAQSGVFQSESGTPMLRMPMNTDAPAGQETTFTWRDTAITATGGFNNAGTTTVLPGFPHPSEINAVLGDETEILYPQGEAGYPTICLPLLMEYRCYPGESVSLNNFDVSIAISSSPRPFFRAFSTGGFNTSGNPVIKNPDNQNAPTGGFNGNPLLGQIGSSTSGTDPTVYIGQMDIVVRVSRAYTTLIEAREDNSPDYVALVQEPSPIDQPTGTSIEFAFRGDDSTADPNPDYFDAADLDLYGNSISEVDAANGESALAQPEWSDSLDAIDSLKWAQVRMSFIGNTQTDLTPTLSALGVAYRY